MAADDSVMKNISQVENYSKNLKKAQDDLRRAIDIIRKQTEQIGHVWKDKQFESFQNDFDHNIKDPVLKAAMMIDAESDYIKKLIDLHRQIRSTNLRK
jgi:hypothetical protein